MGTVFGVYLATGFASGSIIKSIGGPDISGRAWCVQVLNVLAL